MTISYSGDGIVFPDLSVQNAAGYIGFRNRIINGDMRIDQRNNGSAVTPGSGSPVYLMDRFFAYASTTASKLTYQQVVDAPPGFKFSTKVSVAAQYAPGIAEQFQFSQVIEGQNVIDLGFGTAAPATITVSLWVKGSVAGSYSVSLRTPTSGRAYVGTVAVTNAWSKQTVALAGDTLGTWVTDNTGGISFAFDLGSGTNANTTAGSWQAGNFLRTAGSVTFVNQAAGSTLNITGVQFELGSVATPFEQRPIGLELSLCQRYYTTGDARIQTSASGTGNSDKTVPVFKATMRVSPTVSLSQTGNGYGTPTAFEIGINNFSMSAAATSTAGGFINAVYVASAEL
jgi:hypothetical protein